MFVNCLFWGISHSYNCTIFTAQVPFLIAQPGKLQGLPRSAVPGRGRLSRARAIAGAGCGRPSRVRPSIAGLGCAHRGRWVRPSVAGAGCSRPSRARAAPLRARIENACTTSSNMACAIVGACLRLVDFMQRLQSPRQVRFWCCLLRSSTHEENTLQGAGCVDRGRPLQLPEQCCARARPSIASLGCAHRGRGLQPSIAGAGCSIAVAVYSCPEHC